MTVPMSKGVILVVDDDRDNRELLTEALSEQGYETVLAASGEEACQKAEEQEFRLIISDIQMGALSGIELLKWFREGIFPYTGGPFDGFWVGRDRHRCDEA